MLWHAKGRPDVLKDIRIELPLHEQRLTTHFVGRNKRSVFTPHQVSVEDEQGHIIESRDDPRRAFEGQSFETPWDDLHVTYFNSYALWTYLTIPLLYTYPGFITEEPGTVARRWGNMANSLRDVSRRDRAPRGVNYAHDYREVDGIWG